MSSLLSVMLVLSTGIVNYCIAPLTFSLISSPPPRVNKYTVYTRIQCVRGGEYGVIGGEVASDKKNTCRKVNCLI
jgi:hypothetical protein